MSAEGMVVGETAWAAGRLDEARGAQRLLFGRMYEDVGVELAAFAGKGRVFSIASAGDTALALAREHEVVACDINPVQLEYARRRAAGGAREMGDADRAMQAMRSLMPLIGWTRGLLEEFLAMEDVDEQLQLWRERLDTWRFRKGMDVLMSGAVLRRVYSRELLRSLEPGFGAVLRARMEGVFARFPNAQNPYARALLLGSCEEQRLEGEVGERVSWRCGDAASVLESLPEGSVGGFTFSNILDGATAAYRARLMRAAARAAAPEAVVVIRSFGRSTGWPGGENVLRQDRSMLWGEVRVSGSFG